MGPTESAFNRCGGGYCWLCSKLRTCSGERQNFTQEKVTLTKLPVDLHGIEEYSVLMTPSPTWAPEREGERGRDRQTETETQTERDRERQRQRDRETERNRQTVREKRTERFGIPVSEWFRVDVSHPPQPETYHPAPQHRHWDYGTTSHTVWNYRSTTESPAESQRQRSTPYAAEGLDKQSLLTCPVPTDSPW